jgi:tyrosine aminotransferase
MPHKTPSFLVKRSLAASRTFNPIRNLVDHMKVKPNPNLPLIPLSIGDPTIFGNFPPPENVTSLLGGKLTNNNLHPPTVHGYPHSAGSWDARQAVAKYLTTSSYSFKPDDVMLTCGCSQAIDLAISVLANPGEHTILIPRPGFSLYRALCDSKGINFEYYDLLPHKKWQIDLESLESILRVRKDGKKIGAVLINNPSNPCGSNFSPSHIREVIDVVSKYNVPIIADEIYADMAFNENDKFHSFSDVSQGDYPVVHVGGLAKRYMIPGWRLGWVGLAHQSGHLNEVKQGILDLSQLTLGPSSIIQGILPQVFEETPATYHFNNLVQLRENAETIRRGLEGIEGLEVIPAEAAMYLLVKINPQKFKHVKNDVDFAMQLFEKESVFVLPGEVFQIPNFFRIVITPPKDKLEEACNRIQRFCSKHLTNI